MRRETNDMDILRACTSPPDDTRAKGRSIVIEKLLAMVSRDYVIDWDLVYINKRRHIELKNPFHTYEKEALQFVDGLQNM
jgi:proteasome accessory factor A